MNRPDASQITDDQLAALHAERDHLREKVQRLSADLLTAHDQSAGLYATASGLTVNDHGGYCGACGRGDASPNLDAYTALAAERNRLAATVQRAREQAERWRYTPDRKRAAEELLRALDGPAPVAAEQPAVHCNRCHGNEDGPCHEPEHVNGPADDTCCPGCRTPAVVEPAVPDAYELDADGANWRTTAPKPSPLCWCGHSNSEHGDAATSCDACAAKALMPPCGQYDPNVGL